MPIAWKHVARDGSAYFDQPGSCGRIEVHTVYRAYAYVDGDEVLCREYPSPEKARAAIERAVAKEQLA